MIKFFVLVFHFLWLVLRPFFEAAKTRERLDAHHVHEQKHPILLERELGNISKKINVNYFHCSYHSSFWSMDQYYKVASGLFISSNSSFYQLETMSM